MPAYDGVLVTYRYLRLAVVTVLVLLLAAVVVERWHIGPSCWQDSVSAYFYMPVQSVLSASLLARGMGLANRYAAIAARMVVSTVVAGHVVVRLATRPVVDRGGPDRALHAVLGHPDPGPVRPRATRVTRVAGRTPSYPQIVTGVSCWRP